MNFIHEERGSKTQIKLCANLRFEALLYDLILGSHESAIRSIRCYRLLKWCYIYLFTVFIQLMSLLYILFQIKACSIKNCYFEFETLYV